MVNQHLWLEKLKIMGIKTITVIERPLKKTVFKCSANYFIVSTLAFKK